MVVRGLIVINVKSIKKLMLTNRRYDKFVLYYSARHRRKCTDWASTGERGKERQSSVRYGGLVSSVMAHWLDDDELLPCFWRARDSEREKNEIRGMLDVYALASTWSRAKMIYDRWNLSWLQISMVYCQLGCSLNLFEGLIKWGQFTRRALVAKFSIDLFSSSTFLGSNAFFPIFVEI